MYEIEALDAWGCFAVLVRKVFFEAIKDEYLGGMREIWIQEMVSNVNKFLQL